MLIVIIIVAITTAIALPQINVSGIRSKSSVQSLGTTMLALQREAIAKQHNVVVVIDATKPPAPRGRRHHQQREHHDRRADPDGVRSAKGSSSASRPR